MCILGAPLNFRVSERSGLKRTIRWNVTEEDPNFAFTHVSTHTHPYVNMLSHIHVCTCKKWLGSTAEIQWLYNIHEGLGLTHNISQKKMNKRLGTEEEMEKGDHCNSGPGHQKMVGSLRRVGRSNHGVLKMGISSHGYLYWHHKRSSGWG